MVILNLNTKIILKNVCFTYMKGRSWRKFYSSLSTNIC